MRRLRYTGVFLTLLLFMLHHRGNVWYCLQVWNRGANGKFKKKKKPRQVSPLVTNLLRYFMSCTCISLLLYSRCWLCVHQDRYDPATAVGTQHPDTNMKRSVTMLKKSCDARAAKCDALSAKPVELAVQNKQLHRNIEELSRPRSAGLFMKLEASLRNASELLRENKRLDNRVSQLQSRVDTADAKVEDQGTQLASL